MQIFLAPRSNETSHKNFLSTIEIGVDFSVVEPYLTEEGKRILSKSDKLFVWGNRETTVNWKSSSQRRSRSSSRVLLDPERLSSRVYLHGILLDSH